jgi:hypothetical protein
MTRTPSVWLGAALAAAITLPLAAAGPTRWEISTADQWLKGRGEQVAVDREGRITLGPRIEEIHEDTAPSMWAVVAAPDGTVYAGTGNDGRVVALDGDRARTLLDSDELQMHALAWHDDALLAASSPSGKVYRVARDGSSRVFFDPEDAYIWAMVVGPDRDVFVATGSKARVHRVSRDGSRARVVFESAAANVTALALTADGHLLVGTDSPGRLYKVPADGGKAFALIDGPHTQVQAIRPTSDGGAYVLAVTPASGSAQTSSAPAAASTPVASVSTEVSIVAIGDTVVSASPSPSSTAAPSGSSGQGKGTVYKLSANGLSEPYWDALSELPFDILEDSEGRVLVTAEGGAVYRLDGNPARVSRLGQTASQQVTRVTRAGSRYVLAGSNPGKLYALDGEPARAGTYVSDIRDAAAGATWGLLHWEGTVPASTTVSFDTRSGNTSTPDDTWSDWTAVKADRAVSRVTSPPARYLQWRAALKAGRSGASPVLDAVTVTFLGANRRPRVTSMTVHTPGVVFQQPFGTQEPPELAGFLSTVPAPARDRALASTASGANTTAVGRRLYQKGFQTLQWDAQDADGDDLRFRVLVRRVGGEGWTTLATDLVGTVYTWDTTQQADGRYYVRVVATDGRVNPADAALEGEREQGPFTVDNTAPVVTVERTDTKTLRLAVTDATSPLARVDVLQHDGRWMPLFPADGVLDAAVEYFDVPRASVGTGAVVIRAVDTLANIVTIEVPAVQR